MLDKSLDIWAEGAALLSYFYGPSTPRLLPLAENHYSSRSQIRVFSRFPFQAALLNRVRGASAAVIFGVLHWAQHLRKLRFMVR